MKKLLCAAAVIMTVFLLASCGNEVKIVRDTPQKQEGGSDSWTVLVYMMGGDRESDRGAFSEKIKDIAKEEYPSNVNVLVTTGGSEDWHTRGIYSDYTQYLQVMGDGRLYLASQKGATNTGESKTLADFMEWGIKEYKASNYALIIAGEGGGFSYGIGCDERYEDDCLTVEELSYALSSALEKFELVGLDASLMGSVDTATVLAPYTDYLVAPQDVQDTDEWDYKKFLSYLCLNPEVTGDTIGKEICDGYYNRTKRKGGEKYASMSVIDTSKITTLNQAFDGMAGEMCMACEAMDTLKDMMKAQSKVLTYGGAAQSEGWSDLVDMGDMAVKCADFTNGAGDKLIDALNDTVVYSVRGSEQRDATGLSIFFPLDRRADRLQQYMDMSHGSQYKELLRKICAGVDVRDNTSNSSDYTSSWAWDSYNNDMSWMRYTTVLDGNSYELNINGNMDLFDSVTVNAYKYDKKKDEYVYSGVYKNLDGEWDAGIFKLNVNEPLTRFCGNQIPLDLVRSYDDRDIYSVRAMIDGKDSSVRIIYAGGDYKILGYRPVLDKNGILSDSLKPVKATAGVTPIFTTFTNHEGEEYIEGKKHTKFGGGVSTEKIEDGKYIFEFVLTDIYGNKRYGTPVDANVSGGRVSLSARKN